MKFNEFIENVKKMGGVDMDGYYGKQCMDLYNYYAVNVLNLAKGKTGANYAKNLLNNSYVMENVERIDNYPEFVPKKGDIAVWTGGNYGHVAICLGEGDINTFKTIDQNWKEQQLSVENHNYTYMAPIVFLRPKNQENIIGVKKGDKLILPGTVEKWRIYPLDKAPVVGNEKGFLLPAKFGGLEYDIIRYAQPNVAIIRTRDFGEVQIYIGKDTDARIV